MANFWLCANTQSAAFDLLICNIFVPQKVFLKVPLSKISDDVIARDLWFGLSQSKILATPM